MISENPCSGDDQQETVKAGLDPWWVVGFVDGEGCFSVSIHKNELATKSFGWQVNPVFQVYQHEDEHELLERIARFFGCGYITHKGPKSRVLTYSVSSMRQLEKSVIPFFNSHPLRVKFQDFLKFSEVVRSLRNREHWTADGFERVVRLAYSMNANGKQRRRSIDEILAGSSETARQAQDDLGSEASGRYSPILMAT